MLKKIEKTAGVITAIIFFLTFFVWGTRGKFWNIFTAFYPRFHITFLITLTITIIVASLFYPLWSKAFDFIIKHRYKIFPVLGFALCSIISVFVFDSIPHVIDAAHFLWTARVFIETGRFHLPASELYEYYQNTFNVMINGRYFSLFLPGFSVFLIPFELFGIAHLFTPLCNGISVFLLGKIADRHSDERTSVFAMFFAVFSSFYLFMGASFMTHTFNLMLTLFAIYLVFNRNSLKSIFLAGVCGAIFLFIRPQNAVFFYGAMIVFLIFQKKGFKEIVLFTAPFIISGTALMAHNIYYTGHPTIFPQDIYFLTREPYPFCHRLGFGTGCPNTEGDFLPENGLTPGYAFWIAFTRINLMNFNLVGHPLIFIFLMVSFLFSFKKNFMVSIFFIFFFSGYYLFYLPGNLFGPRYFAEVACLLLIPAGYGFFKLSDMGNRYWKGFLSAIPIGIFLFMMTTIMPILVPQYSKSYWDTDRYIERAIEEEGIENSIVFIPRYYPSIFLNLMKKPPFDDRGNIILLDLEEQNEYAVAFFMEKENFEGAYIVDYFPKLEHKVVISPIYKSERHKIYFEFENKRLPITGRPDYGVNFSDAETEDKKFYPVKSLTVQTSLGSVYAMRFDELNEKSYYDFSHPVLEEGLYSANLFFVADYCGSEFELKVNGEVVGVFSSYSSYQLRTWFAFEKYFERGVSEFRITPLKGNSCLMLDSFIMDHLY